MPKIYTPRAAIDPTNRSQSGDVGGELTTTKAADDARVTQAVVAEELETEVPAAEASAEALGLKLNMMNEEQVLEPGARVMVAHLVVAVSDDGRSVTVTSPAERVTEDASASRVPVATISMIDDERGKLAELVVLPLTTPPPQPQSQQVATENEVGSATEETTNTDEKDEE